MVRDVNAASVDQPPRDPFLFVSQQNKEKPTVISPINAEKKVSMTKRDSEIASWYSKTLSDGLRGAPTKSFEVKLTMSEQKVKKLPWTNPRDVAVTVKVESSNVAACRVRKSVIVIPPKSAGEICIVFEALARHHDKTVDENVKYTLQVRTTFATEAKGRSKPDENVVNEAIKFYASYKPNPRNT